MIALMGEREGSFVADALALKEKYGMTDAEYAGAIAGWFIAFCESVGRDPATDLQTAIEVCYAVEKS